MNKLEKAKAKLSKAIENAGGCLKITMLASNGMEWADGTLTEQTVGDYYFSAGHKGAYYLSDSGILEAAEKI